MIEAEWSCHVNVPQLVEQVLLMHDNLPDGASHSYVVLVNRRVSPPGALRAEVARVLAMLPVAGRSNDVVVNSILWFNWQGLASIISAAAVDPEDTLLLQDRLVFLSRAGVQPSVDFPAHQLPELADERAASERCTVRPSSTRSSPRVGLLAIFSGGDCQCLPYLLPSTAPTCSPSSTGPGALSHVPSSSQRNTAERVRDRLGDKKNPRALHAFRSRNDLDEIIAWVGWVSDRALTTGACARTPTDSSCPR